MWGYKYIRLQKNYVKWCMTVGILSSNLDYMKDIRKVIYANYDNVSYEFVLRMCILNLLFLWILVLTNEFTLEILDYRFWDENYVWYLQLLLLLLWLMYALVTSFTFLQFTISVGNNLLFNKRWWRNWDQNKGVLFQYYAVLRYTLE